MTNEQLDVLIPLLSNTLNTISLTSSLIVLSTFSIVAILRPKLIKRTTLRLQIAISAVDFFNATFALFHHTTKEEGSFCTFLAFWRNFGEQMYCFLNVAIAINLQLIFLHNVRPHKYWEYLYWILPVCLALTLSLVPLGFNYYGIGSNGICYIKDKEPGARGMIVIETTVVFMTTFFYLIIVCIMIISKLIWGKVVTNSETRDELKPSLNSIIIRISLYPLVTLIGLSGFIIAYMFTFANVPIPTNIIIWGLVGITTKGFFNMTTFFLDPNIQKAICSLFSSLKKKIIGYRILGNGNRGVELSEFLISDQDTSKDYDTNSIQLCDTTKASKSIDRRLL